MEISELKFDIRDRTIRFGKHAAFSLVLIMSTLSACALTNGRTGRNPQEGKTIVRPENAHSEAAAEHELEFFISLDDRHWTKEGPILVKLRVQNSVKVEVSGICAFTLVRQAKNESEREWDNFWAPLQLQKGKAGPTRGPVPSRLDAHQQFDLEIDLRKLKWGRSVQAPWPNRGLSDIVSAGNYELFFDIELREGANTKRVKSNKVIVSIQ